MNTRWHNSDGVIISISRRQITALATAILLVAGICMAQTARASVSSPPGLLESIPVSFSSLDESNPNLGYYGLGELASGTDGSMWFIESGAVQRGVVGIGRMSSAGVVTGEFTIPTGTLRNEPLTSDPADLALGPDGNMWFTDDGKNVEGESLIGRITPTGRITEFPIPNPSSSAGPLESIPDGIAQGPDGNMWFAEFGAGAIGRISTSGVFLGEFKVPPGTPPADLYEEEELFGITLGPIESAPADIVQGPDGSMWFTDSGRGLVVPTFIGRVTQSGVVEQFPVPLRLDAGSVPWPSRPRAIAPGPDGSMWFTSETSPEPRENFIGKISGSGTISLFPMPQILGVRPFVTGGLAGLVAGPDGNVWFPAGAPDLIGRITPAGVFTLFSAPAVENDYLMSIAAASNGDLWMTDILVEQVGSSPVSHIWRLTAPIPPVEAQTPSISGEALEGQTLAESDGAWNPLPSEISRQWQTCEASGEGCVNLYGETGPTHVLTKSDVGHSLRVAVTARNGWGSSSTISSATAIVVGQPTPPSGPPPPAPHDETLPLVGATLTWRFHESRRYTTVKSLVAHGLTPGMSLEASCRGKGCRFAHKRIVTSTKIGKCAAKKCHVGLRNTSVENLDIATWFKRSRLGPGARISVSITTPGWVGKSYLFTTRSGRSPQTQVGCLLPGATTLQGSC